MEDTQHLRRDQFEDPWVRLNCLLDPKIGFTLTFHDGTEKRFVPFDRSASMSRNFRISFIDADIRDSVNRRLCLDIDFTSFPTVSSKLYAYRGLYLSTGSRVEMNECFRLNEESVLVLKDKKLNVQATAF